MVSHWSLSDLKSPQVSRTLLSILTDLNNAVGWMVSTRLLLFPSPPVPVPFLWWLYQKHQLQLVSPPLSCSTIFQFSSKVYVLFFSFRFLSILLCSMPREQSPQFGSFSCFCWHTRSCRLAEIRWSVCISKSSSSSSSLLSIVFPFNYLFPTNP